MKRKFSLYRSHLLSSKRIRWILALLLLSTTSLWAQTSATIQTDQSDYPPGGTVLITGSGFLANEEVQLQVLHEGVVGDNPNSVAHQPWTVRADENGAFTASWVVPLDEDEAYAVLKLTAIGLSSGLKAETSFTDAPPGPKCIKKVTAADDQTVCINGTVAAITTSLQYNGSTGSPTINYQWYKNTVNDNATGTIIAGATASTYTPSSSTAGILYYYCVVTGTLCSGTAEVSNTVVVTVYARSTDPTSVTASKTVLCVGPPAKSTILTLNGGGGGHNAVVTWYSNGCGTENGGTLEGTGNDFSVKPTVTTTYYGRYEDGTPCNDVTACQSITITIQSGPTITTAAHWDAPVTYGDAAVNFSVAALGVGTIGYQWSVNTGSGFTTIVDGTMYSGTTTASLQLNNPLVAHSGYIYRVSITDDCGVATSDASALVVSPKLASVTPDAKTKVYGASDPTLTGTLNGFLSADNITAEYSRTSGETVAGSPYTISAVLSPTAALVNYSITYNTADFDITKKTASVTPDSKTKVYGDADPTLTGTLNGFLTADNVTAEYSRTSGETVAGSPYTISAVLSPTAALDNYSITYNTANFDITKKTASVTPDAKTKVYGDADPTLTGTLNGFLTADNVTAEYSRTTGETVAGSPYTISASLSPTSVLGNYDITYNTAVLDITKKSASVTPDAKTKIYGDVDPTLTGSLSGFLTADNVTTEYSRTTGETVAGSPYTISASLSPIEVLGNYDITYNTANFVITPKPASVTPDAKSKQYGDADPTLTGTLVGFLTSDNVVANYSRTPGETVVGSPYTISASLSPTGVLGNYTITYNTASFTITPKEVCANYNGIQFANTNVGSTKTTVRLSVVINATGSADARTATVNFVTQNPSGNYVASLDASSTASQAIFYYNWQVDLGNSLSQTSQVSWTIRGNFKNGTSCAETMTDVTVSLKTGEFLTGGGHVIMTASAGTYAGETNRKANFGFNVKWNKSFNSIQGGGFHAIVRKGNFNYQIKAAKVSTLNVVPRTSTTPAIAAFTSTNANLTVIDANTGAIVSTVGNCNLVVEMSDNCEPINGSRTTDLIAITLKDSKGVLLFSNNWNASTAKTVKQVLNGGNIQVMSDANTPAPFCNVGDVPVARIPLADNATADELNPPLQASVYPNPSMDQFNLNLKHGTAAFVQVQVMDVTGRMIRSYRFSTNTEMKFGEELKPGVYLLQISQGSYRTTLKLMKK